MGIVIALGGCTSSPKRFDPETLKARTVAQAAQSLSEGMFLGRLALGEGRLRDRDPNPNAYVGHLLFQRYCDACHGNHHKGPNIIDNRVTTSDVMSDYYIIRYGTGDMPGFRTRLTKFQIYDLLAFMKTDMTALIGEEAAQKLKEKNEQKEE